MRTAKRLSKHTRRLPPLKVGDQVRIQNQIRPHPQKWDKTGLVIEVRQFDQYVIRVDGSGRVTIRNRQFLRKFMLVQPRQPRYIITDDLGYLPTGVTKVNEPPPSPPATIPSPNKPPLSPNTTTEPPPNPTTLEENRQPDAQIPADTSQPATPKKPPLALRQLLDLQLLSRYLLSI
jgi:hypothetical protein